MTSKALDWSIGTGWLKIRFPHRLVHQIWSCLEEKPGFCTGVLALASPDFYRTIPAAADQGMAIGAKGH